MNQKTYGIDHWSYSDAINILNGNTQAILSKEARQQISNSSANVQTIIDSGKTVYGINTGFGPLCDTLISKDETRKLQENLLISHAVGVGNPIDKKISKLMLITKAHALAKGFSGVTTEVVERILLMIERDIIPVVPEQGSVGASGDLAPLAHLFLPLIGEGKIWDGDKIITAGEALQKHGLEPIVLSAKEGLGLING
ncbi:MAG: aromatic amino acid ammonia-lyase, partial [Weeksellaceae bacterium]|nr:aromatic amino acid ammonia-lyase [Weeksellaceae bacterium]